MGFLAVEREFVAAMLVPLWPHLDERLRRLVAGAAAGALGQGGIKAVSEVVGMRVGTVSNGVAELDSGEVLPGRVRREGAGRKKLTEHDPGLVTAVMSLVEPDKRGDPMSSLLWTTKSLRNLAREVSEQGHQCSHVSVRQVLLDQGFSLQSNFKTLEGNQHPDRDAQFHHINDTVKDFQATGDPVLSMDSKKKELVGNFATSGREWERVGQPVQVNGHDFPDPATGKVVPYGVYDVSANSGWVVVGVDHDTAAFAVSCLRGWWNSTGRNTYPNATRLLITADGGGSNSSRGRAWKTELAAFALQTGLQVSVRHFPPGTSKWNRIEHHLFSHITMNWRGRPLSSHEVVVNTIASTTTRTGLKVHAELDTGTYPLGVGATITDEQIHALPLDRDPWHGDWNYTLRPEPPTPIPIKTPRPAPTPRNTPDRTRPAPDWLTHPAITGIDTDEWAALAHTLTELHEHNLKKHGKKHGKTALSLPERLLAAVLKKRLGLHQHTIAALLGTNRHTLAITETTTLLQQAGHTIQPCDHPNTIRDNIYRLAHIKGITISTPPGTDRRFNF